MHVANVKLPTFSRVQFVLVPTADSSMASIYPWIWFSSSYIQHHFMQLVHGVGVKHTKIYCGVYVLARFVTLTCPSGTLIPYSWKARKMAIVAALDAAT